jgi:hypothetical protein
MTASQARYINPMKTKYLILFGIFLGLFSHAKVETAEIQVTFKVVDDLGNPVKGAAVGIATFQRWLPGEGFGQDVYENTDAITDTNGVATVKGTSQEPTIKYGIKTKDGFYYTRGGEYTFKSRSDGKWQPWNPLIPLVFKPILDPIPMYASEVGGGISGERIPVAGKPVGFDLAVGDWVTPYGKGETSDFIFQLDNTITKKITNSTTSYTGLTRTWTEECYDSRLTLRFSNPGDGIQFVNADHNSNLPLPRFAPIGGYQPMLSKREWAEVATNQTNGPFIRSHSDYDKKRRLFFPRADRDGCQWQCHQRTVW